ncbi:hypothetical protein D9599_21210 [Roseomonas sp. KE2513]|uniref:hypothetical protein n=1 Tax=Roseomonas sp. KE2513 TaxID=2479202 RepID=UPI0018DF4557|nr:hypothetical protein [Roseomonas sp. KE2513]MBI0538085.1 hypothetical protein [Roseomonas sp. KE2513]
MRPRDVALIATLGVSLLSAAPASAGDALFGDILALPDLPALTVGSEAQYREREARKLRRSYWERERRLVAAETAAQGRDAGTAVTTIR